jgi:dynein regulatory complex protein 1
VDEDQRQLEAQRVQDLEDYNILKIKLETEVATLEQQLEEMRATYQLNQEKLDYNYRVLVERDSENTSTIKQQKKRLTRMADLLSTLKARYAREERRFKQENADLTDEYKRITDQFKDLQNKFQHFEIADTKRYRDLWQMNEEAVTDLMRKVLQADKIIHEQQLGLSWLPPSEHIFHSGGDAASRTGGTTDADGESGPISRGQMDNENIKHMLEMLCNEAGFLVEGKIQKLLEPLPSVGNFVLVKFPAARSAAAANDFLMARAIIPRSVANYGLPEFLRFTIGTEAEMRAVVSALADFMK